MHCSKNKPMMGKMRLDALPSGFDEHLMIFMTMLARLNQFLIIKLFCGTPERANICQRKSLLLMIELSVNKSQLSGFFLLILALLYATKRRNPTPEKVHFIDNVAYAVSTEWI